MGRLIHVIVNTPAHSSVSSLLTYTHAVALPPGTLVRVPLGKRLVAGIVWDDPDDVSATATTAAPAGFELRPVADVLDGIAPLCAAWRQLIRFTARYYQRSPGEVALAALPPQLRDLDATQLQRRLKRLPPPAAIRIHQPPLQPSTEQQEALRQLAQTAQSDAPPPFVLFGATGSGKTEVYLRRAEQVLDADPGAQALVMVPEINLTPQLQQRFTDRFGASAIVAMHSGMTHPQRLQSWLAAHSGAARIVLGTRMAVFASIPNLRLIVVDEEHDPSYKQQEGARYSARDLAIYRAHLEGAQIILGSATPSLESWHHSRPASENDTGGRYRRLYMPGRIGAATFPTVRLIDMRQQPRQALIAPPLLQAIEERIGRGEQSLLLLNRRGYAPALFCPDCGWKSDCPHCSAFQVFHKTDRTLRCHHCGSVSRVPVACPDCGNLDIATAGRGTQRLEEHLCELLHDVRRPDGQPARIVRIDADTTRASGALESQLAQVHSGDADVLAGTQMITKGHDFRRITLVAALNPDGALFSSDFRAPERLFALLMQAAGRAGRDAGMNSSHSELLVQTFYPQHPLFAALQRNDYPGFAAQQLLEREQAVMPPFSFQALLRADARTQEAAQAFLHAASACARQLPQAERVTLNPPLPMLIQRIANVERAQMLMESASRTALQRLLGELQQTLHELRRQPQHRGILRWLVDVDPLQI